MRKTYIQDPQTLELIDAASFVPHETHAPMVMPDIKPYRSMIDGSIIPSRSVHRTHLRDHGCIEIGNEVNFVKRKPLAPPPGLREKLIQVVHSKGY